MNSRRLVVVAVVLALAGSMLRVRAASEETLTVLCSNGLKAVAEDLLPQFERATKRKVAVRYGLAAALKQQIDRGEPFDVAFLTSGVMDDLVTHSAIAKDTRATIARSGLAIAIHAGARKPDIATVEALKRALLDAKGIAYAKEGASGVAFAALIERLGIAPALQAKSKLTVTGEEVGEAIVKGEVEFGVLPISEILPVKGAEMLAPFPAEVQSYIVMVGGASAASKHGDAARDLIKFFMAPAAVPVIKAKGMER